MMTDYEDAETPYMTFSRTGVRENEEPHAFLGMGSRHAERIYATRMLLHFWETYPETKVWLDGQEFRPTDEEFVAAQERDVKSAAPSQAPREEDEPRRESMREIMECARKRKARVKPCKKGGGLKAMMAVSLEVKKCQ